MHAISLMTPSSNTFKSVHNVIMQCDVVWIVGGYERLEGRYGLHLQGE
jgi:hypothetical protein